MRRSRRGGGSGVEFGSSGEDSFVAVVVTKLTGALLFILLLTMVIMALLPKAVDLDEGKHQSAQSAGERGRGPLKITTPLRLPEAIAGRAYLVALATSGGSGAPEWSAEGALPNWLSLDKETGRIGGVPPEETKAPLEFGIQVNDGSETESAKFALTVLPYQSEPVRVWKRLVNGVPWSAWLEQGIGFLVLWLVHLVGMNVLANAERGALAEAAEFDDFESEQLNVRKRFGRYRLIVRLMSLTAMLGLLGWLLAAPMMAHAAG